jgi:hypothetical protein
MMVGRAGDEHRTEITIKCTFNDRYQENIKKPDGNLSRKKYFLKKIVTFYRLKPLVYIDKNNLPTGCIMNKIMLYTLIISALCQISCSDILGDVKNDINKNTLLTLYLDTQYKKPYLEYLFNGNSNDSSGNNFHGTPGGNPDFSVTDRFGNPSSACYLDGNSYIKIRNVRTYDSHDCITISLWIKPDSLAGNKTLLHLGEPEGASGDYNLYFFISDEKITFRYNYSNTSDGSYANWESYTTNPDTSTWHHVVVVEKFIGPISVYYDGTLLLGDWAPDLIGHSPYQPYLNLLTIGAYQIFGIFTETYTGYIDDIKIYNRRLSPEEVLKLYHEVE